MDVLQQSTNLTAGFITYLQRKQAAGIVNVAPPGHQQVHTHYLLIRLTPPLCMCTMIKVTTLYLLPYIYMGHIYKVKKY